MLSAITGATLGAFRAESARLARSAHNVANVNTPGYEPAGNQGSALASGGGAAAAQPNPAVVADEALSGTDLALETFQQISALQSFKANVAVFRAADEMTRSLLDVRA